MFNLGPMELLVLAVVGIVVIGPEKLPGLARDAAAMLRTLRDVATGARQQLRDELGPEFADIDLRNLNPRTAVRRMVFGDDDDVTRFDPRTMMRDVVFGDDAHDDLRAADPRAVWREAKASYADADRVDPASPGVAGVDGDNHTGGVRFDKPTRPRPRPRPRYDDDVT
ncbi:sec-independent protein translocase protein TatB [Jatrophihabitans endophyticus]|uniref:Sec-independent protein translocase protein TatB n=1 Tax=Jatrophihabitans endophyticus TaxID=1206085 RepID=A0A1M5RLK5_9ACTN|nr:sec-independent translocase [Jatrophihabitans endophyticus]SHH27212.1 sec-independent protein translocase protein TatB [Jatrophihabitans endophyticus]